MNEVLLFELYFPTMKITAKGQVTIPKPLRQAFSLLPGTEVAFEAGEDEVVLRSRLGRRARIRERLRRARGAAGPGVTTDEIMRLTRSDE